jgi:hypothetical protein
MGGHGPRYSEADARAAIAASFSYTEALRRLDMCPSGNARVVLRKYAEEVWRIPVDHFDRNARKGGGAAIPLDQILVERSPYTSRGNLKRRLFDAGLKTRACEMCGQGELWRGRRMALILDHANGIRDDNRLDNLRILCPNCNATLDTHCGRNVRIPREEQPCLRCGAGFVPRYESQRYCSRECGQRAGPPRGPQLHRRRVERPPYEQLVREIETMGCCAVGRKYGVSDNAIRKWRRVYEAERGVVTALPPGARGREPVPASSADSHLLIELSL